MSSIYDWSTTASNNDDADSSINWLEGMEPSDVNNSARAVMARIAQILDDIGGVATATGTANAISVTAASAFSALANGLILSFKAASDNSGATTLAANGLTAKSVRIMTTSGDTALSGGEIQAGGVFLCIYSTGLNSGSGGWQLINPVLGPSIGDMTKAVYDPQNIAGDAFDRAEHTGTQLAATISDFSTEADLRISGAVGVSVQAYSANLDALALVTPGVLGLALLDDANANAGLTTLGLSADGQSLVTAANYAAMRALLDLEAGTDFLSPAAIAAAYQPLDADLTAIAALTTTSFGRGFLVYADEAAFKAGVNLEIGTDVQAYAANLTSWAAVAPASYLTTAAAALAYQPLDGELTALAGLASANGKFPYFTGSGAAALTDSFRVLDASAVSVSHTGDTTETVLATVTIPAGAMGANGALRITSLWSHPGGGADDKVMRARIGGLSGTLVFERTETTNLSIQDNARLIQNRNATNSQVSRPINGLVGNTIAAAVATFSIDTSIAQDLVFTGHLENGANTVTLEAYTVEILYKA